MKGFQIAGVLLSSVLPLMAQWPKHEPAGIPKTRDGKINLLAPAPRTPDGKPDLSGIWTNPTCKECPKGAEDEFLPMAAQFIDIGWGLKGGLPYKPEAAAIVKKRIDDHGKDNPDSHCQPIGIVQLHTHPYPRRIMQSPGMLAILYEKDQTFRQIFTDGRALPEDPVPWWYGYSSGKWTGDTLVIQTIGLRDDGWLDFRGDLLTDAAKVTEKFRRPNYGNLEIELTVDDAKAYTKPWTVTIHQVIAPDMDLFEFYCAENNKDEIHLK